MSNPCKCAEGYIRATDGPDRILPQVHDCHYIEQRNKLIPAAERLANQRVPEGLRGSSAWSREFIKAMDELWIGNRKI